MRVSDGADGTETRFLLTKDKVYQSRLFLLVLARTFYSTTVSRTKSLRNEGVDRESGVDVF